MRKCYYCLILKDRLRNFYNFSVPYSLLLKCPGFLCLFSTPCTNAVDGCDQGAFSENKDKGQQDCTGTLSAGTGNSCSSLCFISPTTFFQWNKKLAVFLGIKTSAPSPEEKIRGTGNNFCQSCALYTYVKLNYWNLPFLKFYVYHTKSLFLFK